MDIHGSYGHSIDTLTTLCITNTLIIRLVNCMDTTIPGLNYKYETKCKIY